MHCLHLDDHTRSLHDALRPNSFDPTNYLPELECPPCDHRPGWKNSYWVADCSVPDKTYHRLCRVPGCVQLCRPRSDDPHCETFESISCSSGCVGTLIKYYVLPSDPPALDELTINSHEKNIMAQNLLDLMSNQFIGCPLARPIVPRNPSSHDRELLQGLDQVAAHEYPASITVSREVFQFANDA